MLDHTHYQNLGISDIHEKVLDNERLSAEDGLRLFECPDIIAVGTLADHVRTRQNGLNTYYVVNRHINYTNVCVNGCSFCAYSRKKGQEGGFTLSVDQCVDKIKNLDTRPEEIHIVGGCHPDLPFDYYLQLVSAVRELLPHATMKCFTATEIAHFAAISGQTCEQVLMRLKEAGLEMLPGGGAEIFDPIVRKKICPKKITGREWLDIHGLAHKLGITTNCTMLFGHLETQAQRVDHLIALREQQDKTNGFTCFIPLPFLTENSALKIPEPLTGIEELKTIAISRLLLDNIPHIKAYWIMLSVKQAQIALKFGADDLDGTVVEEKIGHMAGAISSQALTKAGLNQMIRGCGYKPVERDGRFNPVQEAR